MAHSGGPSTPRAAKVARLMCPICRGFELSSDATADSLFSIIDTNKSGTIESNELLLHLLVAGQEPEEIAQLFLGLDLDSDGVISQQEWRDGYQHYLSLACRTKPTITTAMTSTSSGSDAAIAPAAASPVPVPTKAVAAPATEPESSAASAGSDQALAAPAADGAAMTPRAVELTLLDPNQ